MRLWLCWMLLIHSLNAFADDFETSLNRTKELFSEGKYQSTLDELVLLENLSQSRKDIQGLISYWKGVCFNKLQNFSEAIAMFDKALVSGYIPKDLHYEYGQALFAAEKLSEARIQFRESLQKNHKRAVSLYYIAYISNELGEKKKAVTFYKAIEKLDKEEQSEVRQAAEMQIGDIYLDQVKQHPDAYRSVQTYVIPQYRKALELDEGSSLARVINEKIKKIEADYNLILLKLVNGRPTLNPPYFARVAVETGVDSNVIFTPTELEVAESKKSSPFVRGDILGKYTFYHKNFLSIAPEFRFNYTRYLNRTPEVHRNDNFLLAPAIRFGYEHKLFDKPATSLFDYEYNEGRRDIDANEDLKFSFRSHALTMGERFHFFNKGETILRLRHRIFDSYLSSSNSTTNSFNIEQVMNFKHVTLLLFGSYDMTRVDDDNYDTDAINIRSDIILPRLGTLFTPIIGLGIGQIQAINDSERGTEYLLNPSVRLSRSIWKGMRASLKYDYQDYSSKNKESFAYKKSLYSLEIEYLF